MTIASRLLSRGLTPGQIFNAGFEDWSSNMPAGMRITQDTARKLVAVWACQRLLTQSIATMPIKVFRKAGDRRMPVDDPPWLVAPTNNPNDTIIDHFSDVAMSILGDGNAFIRGRPNVGLATEYLYALPPQKVNVSSKDGVWYEANEIGRFSPVDVLHISLLRKPGELRGMSPVDYGLDTIGIGMAAQEFGAKFFANGAVLSGVIQVPGMMTPEAIVNLRDQFAEKHQGLRKSHAFGVLVNGATFKEMTAAPAQTQLLELRKFTIEDIARLYGVPPHMIGSQEPGAVAYASIEQRAIDYVQNGVQPLVTKIERAYGRLLPKDQYLKFNLAALLRSDINSRYQSYQIALQNKFMTIDEVRGFEDFEPFGGERGDLLQTPNNNAPDAAQPGSAVREIAPDIHVTTPDIRVDPPDVTINVPDIHLDSVRMEAAAVGLITEHSESIGAAITERIEVNQVEAVENTQRVEGKLDAFRAELDARLRAEREEMRAQVDAVAEDLKAQMREVPAKRLTVTRWDDHRRPIEIIEQRGERTIRKLVTRDENGNVESVVEVAA